MEKLSYIFHLKEIDILDSLVRFYYFCGKTLTIELRSKDFKFGIRRCLIFIFLCVSLHALIIWNHMGFWLDDILYPEWRQQIVHAPLFIVGNARSGTTWLHRLVAHDEEVFTTFKTWEIIFAVSITWKRLFCACYYLDSRLLRGTIFQFLIKTEKKLVGHIKVHAVGLVEAEEDEWLMSHIGMCQLVMLFFPLAGAFLNELIMFDCEDKIGTPSLQQGCGSPGKTTSCSGTEDNRLPLSVRRDCIFKYYSECVKRHLYFHTHFSANSIKCCTSDIEASIKNGCGGGRVGKRAAEKAEKTLRNKTKIFVSKNPTFTLRLESLYATFSSAKVVCIVRDPTQSVPSMISYIAKLWNAFASPLNEYPRAEDLFYFCRLHYKFPLHFVRAHTDACSGGTVAALLLENEMNIAIDEEIRLAQEKSEGKEGKQQMVDNESDDIDKDDDDDDDNDGDGKSGASQKKKKKSGSTSPLRSMHVIDAPSFGNEHLKLSAHQFCVVSYKNLKVNLETEIAALLHRLYVDTSTSPVMPEDDSSIGLNIDSVDEFDNSAALSGNSARSSICLDKYESFNSCRNEGIMGDKGEETGGVMVTVGVRCPYCSSVDCTYAVLRPACNIRSTMPVVSFSSSSPHSPTPAIGTAQLVKSPLNADDNHDNNNDNKNDDDSNDDDDENGAQLTESEAIAAVLRRKVSKAMPSLRAHLASEQLRADEFVPSHVYRLHEQCPGMTEVKLKDSLRDVYVAYGNSVF